MSTFSHERPAAWWSLVEVWASLAIVAIWAAVAVTAMTDSIISSNDGSQVPAAVPIALFATIATWLVARYGLRRRDQSS